MSDKKYDLGLDFLKNGFWDELYVLSEHWKSDLEFYSDDLRFLHHLIEKYLMWISKPENLELVKELNKELFDLQKKVKDLLEKVRKHRTRLGYLVENPNHADAGIIKTDHGHLEEEMAQFVKIFRNNRKEVFKITEYIVDSEQIANIMDS